MYILSYHSVWYLSLKIRIYFLEERGKEKERENLRFTFEKKEERENEISIIVAFEKIIIILRTIGDEFFFKPKFDEAEKARVTKGR